jgi:mono/diheme cytochrome c family protein
MKSVRLIVPVASLTLLVAGVVFAPAQKAAKSAKKIDFNKDVRPILSENCFKCHGPDAKFVKGDLRLSDEKDAKKDRDGEFAILPGKAKESLLIKRALSTEKSAQMPPPDSSLPRLTAEQIRVLSEWINQGGKYEKHWALVPPKMVGLPGVKNSKWVRNDIDRFVLAKLEERGLKPAPEADRATLLRRASLSLTGLDPTTEELNAYLGDSAPGAYERAVERMLASQRYGEHEARYWLDAVRYGDTHGYHLDNERSIYPYRDWVVNAFNKDLSFDKFTLWQLAGDMLPNPTREMKVATGYIRMNPTTNEGGSIEEEVLTRNTFDRVDTTSTVFLGLSVGCAKCHDHKYDPISQKDYYGMYAFFNSTKDSPFDGNDLLPPPVIADPTPAQEAKLASVASRMTQLEQSTDPGQARTWLATNAPPLVTTTDWEICGPFKRGSFEEAFNSDEKLDQWRPIKITPGVAVQAINANQSNAYFRTKLVSDREQLFEFGVSSDDGVRVWVNGKLVHSNFVSRGITQGVDAVKAQLRKGENELLIKVANGSGPDGLMVTMGSEAVNRIGAALKGTEPIKVVQAFLQYGPESSQCVEYRKLIAEKILTEKSIPQTLIAEEMLKPRPAFVLDRGEYDRRKEPVDRNLPAVFETKLPQSNRLGLAQWLIDEKNPLTTRVVVNRIWLQHFGTGIVKTAEDFGNQGEWPSHPELLDYLAIKFRKDGFSLKKLHRLIVTSAAFRQSSAVTAAKLQKDPENRLICRGPKFRLDAEVLRDRVLQASGLLLNRQYGPGFKPYQPAGLWEEVAQSASNTKDYVQDVDPSIYRRTLYLFWKRTSPHPVMSTFDAPTREACSVRRSITNTPLQALTTMNEPAFFEAARKFGEKILTTKTTDESRLDFAFRTALSRKPSERERTILLASLKRYQKMFSERPQDAAGVIQVGLAPIDRKQDFVDQAAWSLIASTLFNLDEFLTQH